jgi:hypothetical protein
MATCSTSLCTVLAYPDALVAAPQVAHPVESAKEGRSLRPIVRFRFRCRSLVCRHETPSGRANSDLAGNCHRPDRGRSTIWEQHNDCRNHCWRGTRRGGPVSGSRAAPSTVTDRTPVHGSTLKSAIDHAERHSDILGNRSDDLVHAGASGGHELSTTFPSGVQVRWAVAGSASPPGRGSAIPAALSATLDQKLTAARS